MASKEKKSHTNNKWAAKRAIARKEKLTQKPSVEIRVQIRRNFKRFEVEEAIKRSRPFITAEFKEWYDRNLEEMIADRKTYLEAKAQRAWLESAKKTRNY